MHMCIHRLSLAHAHTHTHTHTQARKAKEEVEKKEAKARFERNKALRKRVAPLVVDNSKYTERRVKELVKEFRESSKQGEDAWWAELKEIKERVNQRPLLLETTQQVRECVCECVALSRAYIYTSVHILVTAILSNHCMHIHV
jgi:YesN/AraC family two-component response regulator